MKDFKDALQHFFGRKYREMKGTHSLPLNSMQEELLISKMVEFVDDIEFVTLMAVRIPPQAIPPAEKTLEETMSALTDAAKEIGDAIKAAVVAVDPAHLATIDAALKSDETDIADLKDAFGVLHASLVPATATGTAA